MDRSKFTESQLKQLDKAKQYWGTELEDLLHAIEETHEEKLLKLLAKEYQRSQRAIKKQIEEIYFKLLESGNVTTTELYKYGRMKALSQNFNKELQRLAKSEYDLMKTELELAYQEAFGKLPEKFGLVDFAMPNKKAIERIVLTPWINRTFSDSIWQNKTKMIRILERELLNCVSLGYSKDKAIQSIMAKTGACFSDAERLVRTELMHVLNDANDTVATESGYTHKQWLTAKDERVCPTCRALEDDVFPVDAQVYSHPRCRCTFIYLKNYSEKVVSNQEESGIIESDEDIKQRIKDNKEYPHRLNKGAQQKHIKGTSRYIEGKSYLSITEGEAQELVNKYAGTGQLVKSRNGSWRKQEVIVIDNVMGIDVNNETGVETPTNAFKIHYSNKGTHIVPKSE